MLDALRVRGARATAPAARHELPALFPPDLERLGALRQVHGPAVAVHDNHAGHPGFDPSQVWKDGCRECAQRASQLPMSMMELDPERFREAWLRAFWWQHDDDTSLKLSEVERPLLRQLWAIQVMLERYFGWPVGMFPDNHVHADWP